MSDQLVGGDPESCPKCGAAWNGLECYECEYQPRTTLEVERDG